MVYQRAAVIGFGAVGPTFATNLLRQDVTQLAAYAILSDDPATAEAQRAKNAREARAG